MLDVSLWVSLNGIAPFVRALVGHTSRIPEVNVGQERRQVCFVRLPWRAQQDDLAQLPRQPGGLRCHGGIADGIDFFHMDALSSAVAMKVNCDLQLTLMASSLYRYLAQRIGHGYETAKSAHLFRDFVDATAAKIKAGGLSKIGLLGVDFEIDRANDRVRIARIFCLGFIWLTLRKADG